MMSGSGCVLQLSGTSTYPQPRRTSFSNIGTVG